MRRVGPFGAVVLGACFAVPSLGWTQGDTPEAGAVSVDERLSTIEKDLAGVKAGAEDAFKVTWQGGLRAKTGDGKVLLRLGGRVHHHWEFFSLGDQSKAAFGDFQDGVEFRRVRVYLQGEFFDHFEGKIQIDFAGGDADFRDVFLALTNLEYVGRIQVGQFKEPFSLEELTSSNDITFVERSLASAFVPSRQTGIMVQRNVGEDNFAQIAIGVFRGVDDFGNGVGDENYNVTARASAAPIYADDGRSLLHVGTAFSVRNTEVQRFRARPEANLAGRVVDTGNLVISDAKLAGFEVAAVLGSFSIQSEFIADFVDTKGPSGDPILFAFYVMGSWVVTGEHRGYDKKNGIFKGIKPKERFLENGWGAIELVTRYSHLNTDSDGVDGGTVHDFTAGTNWYMNDLFKIMFQYTASLPEGLDLIHIGQIRFQFNF
jgi:phosphate-selective porin OprO/OprP